MSSTVIFVEDSLLSLLILPDEAPWCEHIRSSCTHSAAITIFPPRLNNRCFAAVNHVVVCGPFSDVHPSCMSLSSAAVNCAVVCGLASDIHPCPMPFSCRLEANLLGILRVIISTEDMSPTCGTITTAPSLARRSRGSLFEKFSRGLYLV